MEPRLLMSATPFVHVAPTDVAQNLTLDLVDILGVPTVELRQTDTSAVVLQRALTDVSAIEITLSARNDRITVAADFTSTGIGASILGEGGYDTLNGPEGGSSFTVVAAGGAAAGVGFGGFEAIRGGSGDDEIALSVDAVGTVSVSGGAGDDTLNLYGSADVGRYVAVSDGAGVLRYDAFVAVFTGVEGVVDHSATTARSITATPGADAILVTSDPAGHIVVAGPTFTDFAVAGPGRSLTISGGGGHDEMLVTGTIDAPGVDLDLRAEQIVLDGAEIDTRGVGVTGDLKLTAVGDETSIGGTIDDLSARFVATTARITIQDSQIAAGQVSIDARSAATGAGASTGVTALALDATATVGVVDSALLAEGDIRITARTTLAAVVAAQADPTAAFDADAAVAYLSATNRTEIALDDSGLAAAGSITLLAHHRGNVSVRANGAGGEVGATAALAAIDGTTGVALVDRTLFVATGRVSVIADASTSGTTQATATGGGSTAASTQHGARALEARGIDDSGSPVIATATALTDLDQTAAVGIGGTSQITAVGGATFRATATHSFDTTADASATDGGALASAAAVGIVADGSVVDLGGEVTITEHTPRLVLSAGGTGATHDAVEAISGAGAADELGGAGAFALGLVSVSPTTLITGSILAEGIDLVASATAVVDAETIARARLATSEETGGLGASVAVTRLDDDLTVAVLDGAVLEGVDELTFVASGIDDSSATARAGAEGGTSVSPASAMSISDSDARVVIDTGNPIELSGALRMNVVRQHLSSSLADAGGTGDGVAAGAALALDYGAQDDMVELASPVSTTTATLVVGSTHDGSTRAIGSARGAGEDLPAAARAAAAVAEAASRADGGPIAIDAATPLGDLGAAAAVALRLQGGAVEAHVTGGVSAIGEVRIIAEVDVDGSALADASLAGTGADSVDVGAGTALAYALDATRTTADVTGFVSTPGNVTVRAGLAVADSGASAQRSRLTSEAISGATADDLAIGGAVAITETAHEALALVDGAAAVFGRTVSITALSRGAAEATATADGTAGAAGGGIGAGIGVALVHAHGSETATIGTVEIIGADDLVLSATGDLTGEVTAEAGTAGGFIGAAPALALIGASDHAVAGTGVGVGLFGLGNLTVNAVDTLDMAGEARALDASGVAAGAAVVFAAVQNTAEAILARDIVASGRVLATARDVVHLDLDAEASAAGVAADDSDAQGQLGTQAGALGARGVSGASTPTLSVPDGTGAPVPVGVAAALTVASIAGGASALQLADTTVTANNLTMSATGDVDSDVTADASAVDDLGAHVGVGVAVAVNMVETGFDATLAGSVAAGIVSLSAGTPVGDTSTFSATAVSGAGATGVGAAGAFAADFADLDAEASVVDGAVFTSAARLTIAAVSKTAHTVTALSNLEDGAAARLGIGASVALVELDDDAVATLGGGVSAASLGSLTMSATGSHAATATTEAGGAGDVAVTPTLAMVVSTADSRVDLPEGETLTVAGGVTLTVTHDVAATSEADGFAEGSRSAVGAAVALNLIHDVAEVAPGRAVAATGDVRFSADILVDAISVTVAATSGLSAAAAGSTSAGGQAGAAAAYGAAMSGGRSGSSLPTLPAAAGTGGSTQVGVAAALSYNLVDGGARAQIGADTPVTSGRRVTVASAADIDVDADADASTTDSAVGVGAAVAVDAVDAVNRALVDGTVSSRGITVTAGMSSRDDGTDSFGAHATSGAGASNVGVAGAFAWNHAALDTTAEIGATVDPHRSDVVVTAESVHTAVTSAAGIQPTEDDPRVGVGASIAIADFDLDATARIGDGIGLDASGAVTLT
ncbi:MAG: hypothetical protein OEL76_16505, partial [Siculibacillus sp.]|nr:hypothetical protein [Siculibacillus sp.]